MAYWLSISAFLAAILVLFPLPSYWRSRNVPILAIISWLFSVDLVQPANSVIWLDNTRNVIPVWCDISKYFFSVLRVVIHNLSYSATRIMVGASFALPISTLCICKNLEEVSSSRNPSFCSNNFKRRMITEGGTCFGLPLVFIALRQWPIQLLGCRTNLQLTL